MALSARLRASSTRYGAEPIKEPKYPSVRCNLFGRIRRLSRTRDGASRVLLWSASDGLRASRSADEDVEADRSDSGRDFATSRRNRADPRHGRAVGKAFVARRTD